MNIILSAYIILTLLMSVMGNIEVHSGVKGDQMVGGVHLFKIHSPLGEMDLGLKLLLLFAAVLAIVYWCLQQRTKKLARSSILSAAGFAASTLNI